MKAAKAKKAIKPMRMYVDFFICLGIGCKIPLIEPE